MSINIPFLRDFSNQTTDAHGAAYPQQKFETADKCFATALICVDLRFQNPFQHGERETFYRPASYKRLTRS